MYPSNSLFGQLEERTIPLGLNYCPRVFEAGEGDPLVLVPGLAGGFDLIEPLFAELAKTHRVITYELRGEESLLFERNYGFSQLVNDLDALLDALRLETPGVVGVSFGGAIALGLAARKPARLGFLVAQGVGMRFEPGLFGQVVRTLLDRMPLPNDSPFLNQFFRVLVGQRPSPETQYDEWIASCWRTDQSVMAHRFRLLDEFELEEDAERLHTPTLVLTGDRDVVVPAPQSNRLACRLPHARMECIEGAGHLACITHPHRINEYICDFEASL